MEHAARQAPDCWPPAATAICGGTVMTTSHQEFDYSSINGALTPEQAVQALAMGEGDTSTQLEHGGAPATTTATEANSAAGADDNGKTAATADTSKDAGATTEAEDPAQAVVLARDGKHHIPYEVYV